MIYLPYAKAVEEKNASFNYKGARIICEDKSLLKSCDVLLTELGKPVSDNKIIIKSENGKSQGYSMDISENEITITGKSTRGSFYGIQTLRQMLQTSQGKLKCMKIEDEPSIEIRAVLLDVTRGRVPTLSGLKKIADFCALFKINRITLYFEQSFAFDETKDVIPKEERLEKEELAEFCKYAESLFIEVLFEIAVLGHQYKLLQSDKFKDLCEIEDYVPKKHYWLERMGHHCFDLSNPKSIELTKSFVKQAIELQSGEYYHLGSDETFDFCRYKNKGKEPIEEYCKYLHLMCDYVKAYGKIPIVDSDILLAHKEMLEYFPKDICVSLWDYAKKPNEENFAFLSDNNISFIATCSTWAHNTFVENTDFSTRNIALMNEYAQKYNALGVMNTVWGDYGHICDFDCNLYSIVMCASKSWNMNTEFNEKFEMAASELIYGETDENMPQLIGKLLKTSSTGNWYYLVKWASANIWEKEKEAFAHDCLKNESIATDIEKKLTELRSKNASVSHIYDALILAARGIALTNNIIYRLNKGESINNSEIHTWLNEFHSQWLKNNKEGEFKILEDFLHVLEMQNL